MSDEANECDFCGEVDSRIVHCDNCNAAICVDNCVCATNEEHGLHFCFACTDEPVAAPDPDSPAASEASEGQQYAAAYRAGEIAKAGEDGG